MTTEAEHCRKTHFLGLTYNVACQFPFGLRQAVQGFETTFLLGCLSKFCLNRFAERRVRRMFKLSGSTLFRINGLNPLSGLTKKTPLLCLKIKFSFTKIN